MTDIDFSDADAFDRLECEPINVAVNEAGERATAAAALPRIYLGATIVGHECAREIQYDWWCVPDAVSARAPHLSTADISSRRRSARN